MRSSLVSLVGIVIISILPQSVGAQSNTGTLLTGVGIGSALTLGIQGLSSASTLKADAQCIPANVTPCPCGQELRGKPPRCTTTGNKYMCKCTDVTNGFTTNGLCQATMKCKAISTSGADGFGIDKVAGILGQLMGQLMKGSASGGAPTTPTTPTTPTGCTTGSYVTNVVSSDPCAVFVPSPITNGSTTIDNSNVTSALLDALNGGTTPLDTITAVIVSSSTTDLLNQFSTTGAKATITGQTSSTTINPVAGNIFASSANLLPGIRGDISVLNNGATFIANSRDQSGNTEVAGFYGSETTLGTQPTGLVASWCQSRPWSKNFLSIVISPTFFDSLCTLRGYTVGTPAASSNGQTQITITQSSAQPVKSATSTSVAPSTTAPSVDIWASPATVSLGSRTSIFWTSSNAASCTITSPDGSFSQHSLTGGASTVAITAATVFTISCTSADGALHTTKNVTVQMAI